MYRSEINIKHSNRSHLYWGIDKATGEVVDIDDVRSRGLNCNCKCAACNGDFIARKGEKNKHHFAHQSNYECVYANEIAVYLFAKMVLTSYRTIEVPEIPVKIGTRTEIAKNNWDACLGAVFYQCNPEQYARPEDCSRCEFNYALVPKCKCLAMNGIQHLRDIKLPIEQRMESILKLRKENDERHLLIAQMRKDREQSLCRNQRNNNQHNPIIRRESALSVEERNRLGKQEILERMERPSDDPVFDRFHVRWLKCTCCHKIKPSDEMASYGGRHSANMGICRECSRKHSSR